MKNRKIDLNKNQFVGLKASKLRTLNQDPMQRLNERIHHLESSLNFMSKIISNLNSDFEEKSQEGIIDIHLNSIKQRFQSEIREYIEDQLSEQMFSVMEIVKEYSSKLDVSLAQRLTVLGL